MYGYGGCCGGYGGYGYGGGEWILIVLVIFIVIFLCRNNDFHGNNQGCC